MPSKAALSALRALRDEFAARSALGKAADAADATKYTRDIEPRAPFTPEQMREEMRRQALANAPEQKMLQGVYRGFAGENVPAKTAFGNETFFTSPQKRVADYYAKRRAAETGAEPHAEMLLVDPSDLRHNTYGLGLPIDKFNRDFLTTRARRVDPDEVKSRTQLYAGGGMVKGALAAVKKAAEAAGQKAPVMAEKELTTLQDMHTNLGDRVRARSMEAQKMMEGFDYKYDKGQRVFTKDSAGKNKPPYTILNRTRTGNQPVRGDHPELGPGMGKVVIDPETGKAMRTPYEPGYRVRMERGPEDWTEFEIPESAIIGDLEMARGGPVAAFKDGGAATGVFPQMKPRRAGHSGAGERMSEEALKFFIPQDTTDLALMAFPFGKAGKAAAAGLLALTPAESEAGKLKTGIDLARRSFFGLKPSQDMAGRELTTVQRDLDRMQAELNKVDKTAPKVEERAVSIDPGKGTAKAVDVVKKVADTPVSRRTVLKTAAGQVMQNALPASSFADLMKPATVAKQAVQAVAPAALSMDALPALLGEAIRKGMDEKQAVDYVRQLLPDAEKRYFVDDMYHTYKNPELFHVEGEPQGAGEIMRSMMGMKSGEIGGDPLSSMRPRIRAMRERAPEMYDELRQTAKDIAEYGFEP